MEAATSQATAMAGATAAVRRFCQAARSRLRHWLPVLLFAVLIGVQTVARTGDFGGFVDSTKPVRIPGQIFTKADGYVVFWDSIPVNGDAMSFLALTRFMQGQQGPRRHWHLRSPRWLLVPRHADLPAHGALSLVCCAQCTRVAGGGVCHVLARRTATRQPSGRLDGGYVDGNGTGLQLHGRNSGLNALGFCERGGDSRLCGVVRLAATTVPLA